MKIIEGVYWQFPVSLANEELYRNNVIDPVRWKAAHDKNVSPSHSILVYRSKPDCSLGATLINIFVLNSLSDLSILRTFFVRDFLFSLILITGVMAIAKSRLVTVLAVLFAVAISGSLVRDTCAGNEPSNLGCLPVACFLGDARSGGGSTSFSRRTYLRSTGLWGLSLFICYSGWCGPSHIN